MKRLLTALLFAASLAAQPAITGVSPSTGPIEGGTQVTIKGNGFHNCFFCNPPVPIAVYFGGTYTRGNAIDQNTIVTIAPPHLAGTVDITVEQDDGTARRPNAFTYAGVFDEKFERVLLPLLTEPVNGAFGSRFVTQLRVANGGSEIAYVLGLTPDCAVYGCSGPVPPFESVFEFFPMAASWDPATFEYRGKPGAFVYVPVTSPIPSFNLRVFDETRDAFNFGTELPAVFEREFSTKPIKLLGVPLDPRFRNTLRIYATEATLVTVIAGSNRQNVVVAPGANLFEPAYAQFTNFPAGQGTIDVTILSPGTPTTPVWAFISVTNNDTQLITTITPQR